MTNGQERRRAHGFEVEVIRSTRRRKTVQARADGSHLELRVPANMSRAEVDEWVSKMAERLARKRSSRHVDLPARAAALAKRYGLLQPGEITWSSRQGRRWGSCTPSEGTVRVSDRLASMPQWVLDYVIVHELAHLSHPGHGPAFNAVVARYERAERARGYLQAVTDLSGASRPATEDGPEAHDGRPTTDEKSPSVTGLIIEGHRVGTTPESPSAEHGPLVVFVHGAGHDRSAWQEQRTYLEAIGLAAVALDLPGHGETQGSAHTRIASLGDWLGTVVAQLEPSGAHLCGHSMGSLVALDAAARHPALVRSLILVGAAPEMPVHPGLLAAAERGDPGAIDMIVKWSRGRPHRASGTEDPPKTSPTRAMLERCPPGVLGVDLHACDAYTDGRAVASAVVAPTLIIAGGADRMTPAASARRLADIMPDAEYLELDEVGHDLMWEAPDQINDALSRFVTLAG